MASPSDAAISARIRAEVGVSSAQLSDARILRFVQKAHQDSSTPDEVQAASKELLKKHLSLLTHWANPQVTAEVQECLTSGRFLDLGVNKHGTPVIAINWMWGQFMEAPGQMEALMTAWVVFLRRTRAQAEAALSGEALQDVPWISLNIGGIAPLAFARWQAELGVVDYPEQIGSLVVHPVPTSLVGMMNKLISWLPEEDQKNTRVSSDTKSLVEFLSIGEDRLPEAVLAARSWTNADFNLDWLWAKDKDPADAAPNLGPAAGGPRFVVKDTFVEMVEPDGGDMQRQSSNISARSGRLRAASDFAAAGGSTDNSLSRQVSQADTSQSREPSQTLRGSREPSEAAPRSASRKQSLRRQAESQAEALPMPFYAGANAGWPPWMMPGVFPATPPMLAGTPGFMAASPKDLEAGAQDLRSQAMALLNMAQQAEAAAAAIRAGSPKREKVVRSKPVPAQPVPDAERTSLTLQNLPFGHNRDKVVDMLNAQGFAGTFDFVYMPYSFRAEAYYDYALVDFRTPEAAQKATTHFEGFGAWDVPSDKCCEAFYSQKSQGLQALVERYRSSPVMHASVPDAHKPAVFGADGKRTMFPAPTKPIRPLRYRQNPGTKRFNAKRLQQPEPGTASEAEQQQRPQ